MGSHPVNALVPGMSEAEWQEQVIDLAHLYSWRHMHVRRAIGKGRRWVTATNVAWPDLTLWHPGQGRTICAELKSATGVVTAEQRRVLDELDASGVPSYVWRPDDLDDIAAILAPGGHR